MGGTRYKTGDERVMLTGAGKKDRRVLWTPEGCSCSCAVAMVQTS